MHSTTRSHVTDAQTSIIYCLGDFGFTNIKLPVPLITNTLNPSGKTRKSMLMPVNVSFIQMKLILKRLLSLMSLQKMELWRPNLEACCWRYERTSRSKILSPTKQPLCLPSSPSFRSSWKLVEEEISLEERLCEKIKLTDGWTAYVLWRFVWPDHFLKFGPQEFECFEAGKEDVIADVHPKLVKFQDHPNDQGKELFEFSFIEEGKEA